MTTSKFLRQGVDYLGFLEAKLRDLRGFAALVNELIQNADDAPGVTSMKFDICDAELVVENNGSFREIDFERMQNIAGGGKREEEGTTGAFGIGFIAVYQITDHPELFSTGRHWIFRPEEPEERRIEESIIEDEGLTRFRLPWAMDPDSPVRRALRIEAVSPEDIERFTKEISEVLPDTMLFLRKLERIELCCNGKRMKLIQRLVDRNQIIIQDGTNVRLWYLLSGHFVEEEKHLRAEFGARIEPKRSSEVKVAIPEPGVEVEGRLCAYLPTQHRTRLPFHINADFFPSSDRKRILFENDYQARWNEAAIRAAAKLIANELPKIRDILGHKALWDLINRAKGIHQESEMGKVERVMGEFWTGIRSRIMELDLVWTSTQQWKHPSKTYLLEHEDEHLALPVLEKVGLDIVHPDLRPYFGLLRSRDVDVSLLGALELADALISSGLTHAITLEQAPHWLQSVKNREILGQEIEILLNRRMIKQGRKQALEALGKCSIALGVDGRLHPPKELYQTDEQTAAMFRAVGLKTMFVSNDNHHSIINLVPEFDLVEAIKALEQCDIKELESNWKEGFWEPKQLISWFSERKSKLIAEPELRVRFIRLSIFPSSGHLCPLVNLAVPGTFEDPLNLATLVDLQSLPGLREFLIEFGAKELTFDVYARQQVPHAFSINQNIPPELRRKLVVLLAKHMGEILADEEIRDHLARCSLVECNDGEFRKPSEVYLHKSAIEVLGPDTPVAVVPKKHRETIHKLYKWLGVAERPRPSDLLMRIRSLTATTPSQENRKCIQGIFAHLAERWDEEGNSLQNTLADLKTLAWLPALGDNSTWYHPSDVYAAYRSHLFETQGRFLDIDRSVQVQSKANNLMKFLGVQFEPKPIQVVKHLLTCIGTKREVNQEVYRYLNDNAEDGSIQLLRDKACLLLPGGTYVKPSDVFWNDHPFGRYRFRLGSELRRFNALFEKLGVKELPQATDAFKVLREISDEFGNNPLDEEAYRILLQCWVFLGKELEDGALTPDILVELRKRKVIPDDRKVLNPPGWMFFDDRPGLAQKFGGFLDHNVIPRIQGAWRAMMAAGVRQLSQAIKSELVDCQEPRDEEEVMRRLEERRLLLARVAELSQNNKEMIVNLASLNTLVVKKAKMIRVRYTITEFKNTVHTEPEEVKAYFEHASNTLYCQPDEMGQIPWAALARELAYAIMTPSTEAGQFASGIKEVLIAESYQEASQMLDDLGYPHLKEIGNSVTRNILVNDLGGKPVEETDYNLETNSPVGSSLTPPEDVLAGTTPDNNRARVGGTKTVCGVSIDGDEQNNSSKTPRTPIRLGLGGQGPGIKGRVTSTKDKGYESLTREEKIERLRSILERLTAATIEPLISTDEELSMDEVAATLEEPADKKYRAAAMDYERSEGRFPEERTQNQPGYDIVSYNGPPGTPGRKLVRRIEVKGRTGTWEKDGVVSLSRRQFMDAIQDTKNQSDYWLYVVCEEKDGQMKVITLRNPASRTVQFELRAATWRWAAEDEKVLERKDGNGCRQSGAAQVDISNLEAHIRPSGPSDDEHGPFPGPNEFETDENDFENAEE